MAICMASASAIASATSSLASPVRGAPAAAASPAGITMSRHDATTASAAGTVAALRRSTS
jgi:hypothetical protein